MKKKKYLPTLFLLLSVLCLGIIDAQAFGIKIIPVTPTGALVRPAGIVGDDALSTEATTCPGTFLADGGELCTVSMVDTLYVADAGNGTIKRIIASVNFTVAKRSTGTTVQNAALNGLTIDTIARGFAFPVGLALWNSDATTYLYVSDLVQQTIQRINLSSGLFQVETVAGIRGRSGSTDGSALGALLNGPAGMTIKSLPTSYVVSKGCSVSASADEVPVMLIAEYYGKRIRAFTFADDAPQLCILDAADYDEPTWVASGSQGFVSLDRRRGQVYVTTPTSRQSILTRLGEFSLSVATDNYGSVYVTNNDQNLTSRLIRLRWNGDSQTHRQEALAATATVCDPFETACDSQASTAYTYFPFSTVSGMYLSKGLAPEDYIGRLYFGDVYNSRVYLLFDPESADSSVPPRIY